MRKEERKASQDKMEPGGEPPHNQKKKEEKAINISFHFINLSLDTYFRLSTLQFQHPLLQWRHPLLQIQFHYVLLLIQSPPSVGQ